MRGIVIRCIIATIIINLLFIGSGLAVYDQSYELKQPVNPSSGYLTVTDTHFKLNNIKYPDLTINSSNPVNLTFKSVSEMVNMRFNLINDATATHITLNGLTPLTTYYKYEDDYHNQTVFTTDSNGIYTYTQDLTEKHYVFIIPCSENMSIENGPNVKFISDDATGGDCTSIGTWDFGTKTCTLTTDFSGTIQIDSDCITLDGNGHTLTGSNTGNGVYIFEKEGFTIKDLEIQNFDDGITCGMGIWDISNEISITGNIISNNNNNGISVTEWPGGNKTTINENIIFNNNNYGIFLSFGSCFITVTSNTIYNNSGGLATFDVAGYNTITDNIIYENRGSGIILCQSSCEYISNNIIIDNFWSGIFLEMTGGHNIKDNIIHNNECGINLYEKTSSNDITGNTISNNDYGIYVRDGNNNNLFYHNFLINNTIYNAYEYLETGSNYWDNGLSGNLWSNYDEPGEGCIDIDNNGICDLAYVIPGGSGIDHYPMVHWIYEWTGVSSDGGSAVTTSELQDAIHHWLDDIPVRNHLLSTEDLQQIIVLWLG